MDLNSLLHESNGRSAIDFNKARILLLASVTVVQRSLVVCVHRARRVFMGTGNVMFFSSRHSHFVTLLFQFWECQGMIFIV